MKRILIAGGAGFLGSHLAEKLVADFDVTIVDNLSSGMESNIKNINDRVEFIKCDVESFSYDKKIDIIIDLASRASRVEWETYPVEVALSNSIGTNNLIKLALKNGSPFIYASSSEIYGEPDIIPTPETYVGKVDTISSRAPYDEGKRFSEALIKSYEKEYGLENIIIRFFNTYGPRMRGGDFYGRVLDRFIKQSLNEEPITVYGSGDQTRSFTFVSDAIEAIELILRNGKYGEIYNIGNDQETKIIDLARLVIKLTSTNSDIIFKDLPENDPFRRSADITKMTKLGWKHKVSLESGILQTIESHNSDCL